MPRHLPIRRLPQMSNDAFAGFLRLLLTPLSEVPEQTAELDAYLSYLGQLSPKRPTGSPGRRTQRAA